MLKLRTQASRLAEAQRKRRHVEEQLQAAREFLEKNQYSSAIALLERALETIWGPAVYDPDACQNQGICNGTCYPNSVLSDPVLRRNSDNPGQPAFRGRV